ncbi:MAG TPA: FlgD immunoglobulin-like domain containing protein [Candidatus Eisenbacteria bacterium]|nr:FlgD immunoglobulin-like domain containing protein [Candidatus Eisenbacteria bacterium]
MRPRLTLFLAITVLAHAPSALAVPLPGLARPTEHSASLFDHDDHMAVNQLDMLVSNHGSLAYDIATGNGGLVYPTGTVKTALFAAGIWIGAKVNGAVRVALGEYAQEYWPGPMSGGSYQADQPAFHNFAFDAANQLSPGDLADYASQGGPMEGSGHPLLFGDATIWSVFNDANPLVHHNTAGSTNPLGVEVQQTVCAYSGPAALGKTIFVKWKVTAKGPDTLDSAYVSIWCDPDLGGAIDDLVGCDTTLALGYCYNATNADPVYGSSPPAVGITLIRGAIVSPSVGVSDTLGMTSFDKYIGGTDPANAGESYAYMRGVRADGTPWHVLDDPLQPETRYPVSGLDPSLPSSATNWLDSNPADRRLMLSTGPFSMAPGESQEIIFAILVGQGANRFASISALKSMVPLVRPFAPAPSPGTSVGIVSVDVALIPETIDLASRAPWVDALIEPSGARADAIDAGSVRLAGVAPDGGVAEVADHDANGRADLLLRFPRASLDPRLMPGAVSLDVSGRLRTGDSFEGTATLRVVDGRHAPLAASLAPLPMRPAGNLRFVTTRAGSARVSLFDARGRRVRTLLMDRIGTGAHTVAIDGRDDHGRPLGSGLYWFRIEAAEGIATGRVVLLR